MSCTGVKSSRRDSCAGPGGVFWHRRADHARGLPKAPKGMDRAKKCIRAQFFFAGRFLFETLFSRRRWGQRASSTRCFDAVGGVAAGAGRGSIGAIVQAMVRWLSSRFSVPHAYRRDVCARVPQWSTVFSSLRIARFTKPRISNAFKKCRAARRCRVMLLLAVAAVRRSRQDDAAMRATFRTQKNIVKRTLAGRFESRSATLSSRQRGRVAERIATHFRTDF